MRTYAAAHGGTFNVPAASFTAPPEIHTAPRRFPFAVLAGALGQDRDHFARLVARLPLYDSAKDDRRFRHWAEKAGASLPGVMSYDIPP